MAGKVEHLIGGARQLVTFAHLFDEAIPDEKTSIRNLAAEVIHRNQNRSIFDEQSLRHGKSILVFISRVGNVD
jgi:hypothetical protein